MYAMQITVKIDGDQVRMVGLVGTQSIFQRDMPHLSTLGMDMISGFLEVFQFHSLQLDCVN